jgi:hypothetical protein
VETQNCKNHRKYARQQSCARITGTLLEKARLRPRFRIAKRGENNLTQAVFK